jgi:glutathione S-transferase
MKLFYSQTSPYARKVRLAAQHLGLTDRIELVAASTTPIAEDAALAAAAPLGKIPALVLDDGTVLFDSRVIVEYLDHLAGGGRLVPPASDPARWRSLRRQAAADGLLDAALLMRYEVALRPGELLWRDWLDGQNRKVARALAALEAEAADLADGPALDAIAVACALGYLDFRFADMGWRAKAPGLAAFFAEFSQKPEMAWTDPTAG